MRNLAKLRLSIRFCFYLTLLALFIIYGYKVSLTILWAFIGILWSFELILAHLFFNYEKRIRKMSISRFEFLKMQLFSILSSCLIPILATAWFASGNVFKKLTSDNSYLIIGSQVLFTLAILYFFKLLIKFLSKKTAPLSNTQSPKLELIFKEALAILQQYGKSNPSIKVVDLAKLNHHNALATNNGIIYTRSLEQELNPEEFRAIILHEVAHIILKHTNTLNLIVRVSLAIFCSIIIFILLLFSFPLVTSLLWINHFQWHEALSQIGIILPTLSGVLSLYLILAWLSRRREYKADKHAIKLGAIPSALASALIKLEQLNYSQPTFANKLITFLPNLLRSHPQAYQRAKKL